MARIYAAILILVLMMAAPVHAVLFDWDDPNLVVSDIESLKRAVRYAENVCRESERSAQSDFNQERRAASRSLGALDRSESQQQEDIRRAQKKFNRRMTHIETECEDAKKTLVSRFLNSKRPAAVKVKKSPAEPKKVEKKSLKVPAVGGKPKPLPQPKSPPMVPHDFRVHGRLSHRAVERMERPRTLARNQTQLILQESFAFSEDIRFKSSQRAYYDSAIDHRNDRDKNQPGFVEDDQDKDFELREMYLDLSRGDWDLRVGRQSVVWGDAVSLFIADAYNGKDLREFILPDFELIRIPQLGIDATLTKGRMHHEFAVTIPEFNKLGTPGSEFAFPRPVISTAPVIWQEADEPDPAGENMDYGLKSSVLLGGLDLGVFYLYTWEKSPIPFLRVTPLGLAFDNAYRRQNIGGLTFSKDVGSAILKGEAAVRPNSYFVTTDLSDLDGVVRKDVIEYVLGVDQSLFGFDANVQVNQKFIRKATDNLVNEKGRRTLISLWLKRTVWNDRLELEYLIVSDVDRKDRLQRPKASYKISDRWIFRAGLDVFQGHADQGLFGIFKDKSRVFGQLECHF